MILKNVIKVAMVNEFEFRKSIFCDSQVKMKL